MALDFSATYKVLVLGDSNVGKTCIVHRYCDERWLFYPCFSSILRLTLSYMFQTELQICGFYSNVFIEILDWFLEIEFFWCYVNPLGILIGGNWGLMGFACLFRNRIFCVFVAIFYGVVGPFGLFKKNLNCEF